KVGIRPALMIAPTASPAFARATPQDATQSHPDPFVQRLERPTVAMLEVLIPTSQRSVHSLDDAGQALAVVTPSLDTDRLFEFLKALLARPVFATLEVIPQKIKAAFRRVDDSRLDRMQRQSGCLRPLLDFAQRLFRFGLAAAQDDEIIRVAHHFPASPGHQVVERVEIDV